eukprot:31293-Lingulodinium_polyedra.AAC.1
MPRTVTNGASPAAAAAAADAAGDMCRARCPILQPPTHGSNARRSSYVRPCPCPCPCQSHRWPDPENRPCPG